MVDIPSLPAVQSQYTDDGGRPTPPFADFLRRLINWAEDNTGGGGGGGGDFPILNVQDFGATGDGVTDDTVAINAAEAARAATGVWLYFPGGTYVVSSLSATTPRWFGDGPEATVIQIASSSSAANGVTVGAPTGATQYTAPSIEGMTINANGKCSGAALLIRNITRGTFANLIIKFSAGHGLRSDTATSEGSGNSYLSFNFYYHIRSENNALDGFHWTGEHFSDFQSLFSLSNRDGFVWENFTPDFSSVGVGNEECTGTAMQASNCTRDGFRFDSAEKHIFGELISTGSLRYGISFWFDTNAAGTLGNGVKVSNFSSRNDRRGGFYVDPNDGGLFGATFGEVALVGYSSDPGTVGVVLAAAQNVKFGNLMIIGWPGIGMSIQQGSPKGGAVAQSNDIQIGNLSITGCGAVGQPSTGLLIQDSTTVMQISNLRLVNLYTTGSEYEIICGSTAGLLYVGTAIVSPATGGNEEQFPGRITYALKNF